MIVGGESEDRGRDIHCWDLGFQVETEYTGERHSIVCLGDRVRRASRAGCVLSLPADALLATSTASSTTWIRDEGVSWASAGCVRQCADRGGSH